MTKQLYLETERAGVGWERLGPFATHELRDAAAARWFVENEGGDDNIVALDVYDDSGFLRHRPYSGEFAENAYIEAEQATTGEDT